VTLHQHHAQTQQLDPIQYNSICVPVRYFGQRPQVVPLPTPITQAIAETATQAFLEHHTHHCTPCLYLSIMHRIYHPPLPRAAIALGVMMIMYVSYPLMAGELLDLPRFLIVGSLCAVTWVHLLLAGSAIAALIHRRHMPIEMVIRVHHAHTSLTRPGAEPEQR
jgi:hypothetical protein